MNLRALENYSEGQEMLVLKNYNHKDNSPQLSDGSGNGQNSLTSEHDNFYQLYLRFLGKEHAYVASRLGISLQDLYAQRNYVVYSQERFYERLAAMDEPTRERYCHNLRTLS